MHATLILRFAFLLLSRLPLSAHEAMAIASDVAAVVDDESEAPLFDPLGRDSRLRSGLLIVEWGIDETRMRAKQRGDSGRACGRLQMWIDAREYTPCDKLDGDRLLDFRLALHAMRRAAKYCGSVSGGMRLFSSGKCDHAVSLARKRCEQSGAMCDDQ